MKLSALQIRQLVGEIFSEACLQETVEIKEIADALDQFRIAIEEGDPLRCFDEITLNRTQFDRPQYLPWLAKFQRRYYDILTHNCIYAIEKQIGTDNQAAYHRWFQSYINALICWKDHIINNLCNYSFAFSEEYNQEIILLKKLNSCILNADWIMAFPIFEKLAGDENLTAEQKSAMQLVLAEIIIFWKPQEDAMPYIQKAQALYTANERISNTLGNYYCKKGAFEKGREFLFAAISKNKNYIDNYTSVGDSYRDEGNIEQALTWYENALAVNFLNAGVYSKIISIKGEKANTQETDAILAKVAILEPNATYYPALYNAYRDTIYRYSMTQDYEKAIFYAAKAVDLKPELLSARSDLAYVLFYNGQQQKAVETALAITEAAPDYYDAWLALAFFYEKMDRVDEAVAMYKKCMAMHPEEQASLLTSIGMLFKNAGRQEEARDHLSQAVAVKPDIYTYESLRAVYETMQDTERLIAVTEILSELDDKNCNYFNLLGIYYYNRQQYSDAIVWYQKSIERAPQDAILYQNLALAHEKNNDTEDALKNYYASMAIEETYFSANAIGVILFRQNNFDEAIRYYIKAITLNNNDPVLYENCGLAYEAKGLMDEAEKSYSKAAELEKISGVFFNRIGLFYYNQGSQFSDKEMQKDVYGKAISWYARALEREPDNTLYFQNIALAWERMDNFTVAMRWYQKAAEVKADDALVLFKLGYNQYKAGYNNEALESLKRAIKLEPQSTLYYDHLGYVYELIKEDTNALKIYQDALEANKIYETSHQGNLLKNHHFLNRIALLKYKSDQPGNLKESVEYYNKAIALDPLNAEYYGNIALAYRKLGDEEKAIVAEQKHNELASSKEAP